MNAGNTPPPNARHIWSRKGLPAGREPLAVRVESEGNKPRVITLQKTQRQVAMALRDGPIYCASPIRLSDIVFPLKREHRLDIETKMFSSEDDGVFGIYILKSRITPMTAEELAA